MSTHPLTAAEIVEACLGSNSEDLWARFVQYFQPLIASSVNRVARRYGMPDPSLIDDLVQETYLRLCKNNCKALRGFQALHDDAIFGYIKVIATSVALDYFRARATHKRRGEVEDDGTNLSAITSPSTIEQSLLLKELDERLSATETERDRTIFWLYYRQGYTAKDIAAIPGLELEQKGVESCIHRLTHSLRNLVGNKPSNFPKGLPPQNTLGVMK
jgi:RNA polymerase sigma-70 factor (ECF subfamily)